MKNFPACKELKNLLLETDTCKMGLPLQCLLRFLYFSADCCERHRIWEKWWFYKLFTCWLIFRDCLFVVCWFFQKWLFQKILLGTLSECRTVWIQIRADILSVLISVQTVFRGHQQTSKDAASKERVEYFFSTVFNLMWYLYIFLCYIDKPHTVFGFKVNGYKVSGETTKELTIFGSAFSLQFWCTIFNLICALCTYFRVEKKPEIS